MSRLRVIAGRPVSNDNLFAEAQRPIEVEPHRFNPEPIVAAVCVALFAIALWVLS